MVESGVLDELQKDNISLGLRRMFEISSNTDLMLTLERLSSRSDLDELFMKIVNTSIKILVVILNHMTVNQKKQFT